jgi:DNA-binding transcriptional LysR family regulator
MLPDLESLRCFVAAADTLNFRAAARVVGLTPAALGQRIRQLEGALEVRLFHRTTRKVELTEAGMALLPKAQQTLDAARECVRAARGELGPPPMELTVGTRHELGLSWVQPMLPDLESRFPWVTFHLYFGSGADLALRLLGHEIDCAISSRRITEPGLDSVNLHREDYVFVASPHLLAEQPLDRLADTGAHTLLDIHADLPLYRYFRETPAVGDVVRFAGFRRMGTIAAIRAGVMRGAGVAVLPEYLVRGDLAAGDLVPVLADIALQPDWFRLVFRTDDPRVSTFRAMGEAMRAHPLR